MQRVPPELTERARALRNASTEAERRLWHALRNYRPRFTRQLVISHFIVDFACRTLRIAVEIDGGHHAEQLEQDAARTAYLSAQGWQVLRYWNNDVLHNLEGVARDIDAAMASRNSTLPRPLPSRAGSSKG